MPSEQSQGGLTSQIMRTLWPTGANMRSKEIVLAVLVKGHRTDPVQVWVYQTLTTLKTMFRSSWTWIPLWRQAWEAMQKRIVKPGTEGLAAKVDRVLRRLRWLWENALEVRREEGEKNVHHPESRRPLETQNSACGARVEAPTSRKQKISKRLQETRHSNVHPTA